MPPNGGAKGETLNRDAMSNPSIFMFSAPFLYMFLSAG